MTKHALAAAVVLLAGCGPSTQLQNVWTPPDVQPVDFRKVLAVAVTSEPSIRRSMEDAMVALITRAPATQSYLVLSEAEYNNQDAAKQKVLAEGFDGAIIMRVVRMDSQQSYMPGTPMPAPYYSPWGYWGYSYSYAYSPGYMVTDEYVTIETNLYSLKDDKLLYSAQSESLNPDNINDLVGSVAEATVAEMHSRGLLK